MKDKKYKEILRHCVPQDKPSEGRNNLPRRLKYLGVIPARGGSKSIPRKNIKKIAGKPLIAWTIEAAKKSKRVDDFIVSTEDDEIAEVSRKFGAKVLPRPKNLATDTATTLSVLQQVLKEIPAENIVLLQPTSPARSKGLIDKCIKEFERGKFDNLGTGFICKFMEYGSYSKRRQELKGFFYDDGNVYVIKADLIKNGKMFGEKVGRIFTSREENVEIDEEFDFWLAEQILKKAR
ncbi:MAG: acylneuraminate cytidylyltransferase family protein [Candidatus Omnitrophica bacterium]|nr:acylneuraminate cytidylyltransferase family protein [Candidatus Omnitrophota bacterium]